jgi:hypothetical protein
MSVYYIIYIPSTFTWLVNLYINVIQVRNKKIRVAYYWLQILVILCYCLSFNLFMHNIILMIFPYIMSNDIFVLSVLFYFSIKCMLVCTLFLIDLITFIAMNYMINKFNQITEIISNILDQVLYSWFVIYKV